MVYPLLVNSPHVALPRYRSVLISKKKKLHTTKYLGRLSWRPRYQLYYGSYPKMPRCHSQLLWEKLWSFRKPASHRMDDSIPVPCEAVRA